MSAIDPKRTFRAYRACREVSARIARATFQISDRFAKWPEARAKIFVDAAVARARSPEFMLAAAAEDSAARTSIEFLWDVMGDMITECPARYLKGTWLEMLEEAREESLSRLPSFGLLQ